MNVERLVRISQASDRLRTRLGFHYIFLHCGSIGSSEALSRIGRCLLRSLPLLDGVYSPFDIVVVLRGS